MTETEQEGGSRQLLSVRGRAPLVITLVIVAVVGAAYYAYYRKQADYFTGRNLRLLSMMAAQIEGRVEMFAGFARRPGKSNRGLQPISCAPENRSGHLRREILESEKGWNVVLQPEQGCFAVPLDSLLR